MLDLNFKKFGDKGPGIIILHGMLGMLDNWQTIARKLQSNYQLYLIDQRNHGRSPHHETMNYPVMAEDIEEWMEYNRLENAKIIGHSMGGKVAMQLAVTAPEKVAQLIVVDIAPKEYAPGHDEIFAALEAVPLDEISSRQEAAEAMADYIDDAGVQQFLLKNLYRDKEKGYQWRANIEGIKANYEFVISNSLLEEDVYKGETLFIKGANSLRYIEMTDWYTIINHFPNANLEIIDKSGHWVHAEQPQKLMDLIRDFIDNQ